MFENIEDLEQTELEPALNLVSAPFMYMVQNNFITFLQPIPIEEQLKLLSCSRLKQVSDKMEYFKPSNIIKFIPSDGDTPNTLAKHLRPGVIYSLNFSDRDKLNSNEPNIGLFEYQLFLDITRNGMRLVVPIYGTSILDEDKITFTPISFKYNSLIFDIKPEDKLLIIKGDNLRTTLRRLKQHDTFKTNVTEGYAGITGAFSEDAL